MITTSVIHVKISIGDHIMRHMREDDSMISNERIGGQFFFVQIY